LRKAPARALTSRCSQDELFTVLPAVSILELVVVLLYLGHFSGCFFYYFSCPKWWAVGAWLACLAFLPGPTARTR
jgi:hypothetical protein